MNRTCIVATALSFGLTIAHAAEPLQMKVYSADAGSFHVSSVLVSGNTEAVLVDAGFTRADAYRIAANVLDSGKRLKTIFVSQADPDYYFGVEVLKAIFPDAEVLSPPGVLERIEAKLQGKIAFWGPKMGANAPRQPVLPKAFNGTELTVDGQALEIRGLSGELAHRPYVWIPSLRAIVGNVAVFGNLHVWTADTQTEGQRQAWLAQLDEMKALRPAVVVPGHMQAGTLMDVSAIDYTRGYLQRFALERRQASGSAALIGAMKQAYPEAGMGIALDIGAKVATGEMKW